MKNRPHAAFPIAVFVLLLSLATPASAVTYRFLGECATGCTGLVTARISFNQDYTNTLGEKADQVVRFDYDSSNVSFSVSEAIFDSVIQGSFFSFLPFSTPTAEDFSATGSVSFETELDGSWLFQCEATLCGTAVGDAGGDGIWQLTAIPVPGAVWLLGSGLAGLVGLTRRRRVS